MFKARNIHYETAERTQGLACGGIGVMELLVATVGLDEALNEGLHLLKRHLPYHESDHVLNIAYNILMQGRSLEDLELLRNDVVYLNALGAQRIPDPTTAGDFCRRFTGADVEKLLEVINEVRLKIWALQSPEFFEEAILEVDGTMVPTTGECKAGMEYSYTGVWGYHPLVITLANTGEVLYVVNRSGNRPSHEGAPEYLQRAMELCRRAGFRRITLRGDTDFSLTEHLDGWHRSGIRFILGYDLKPSLSEMLDNLLKKDWERLEREPRYEVQTEPRQRPENVKEQIVVQREFENKRLRSEDVTSFEYSPQRCQEVYRMVAVRKNLSVEKGEAVLFDDLKYHLYITNDHRVSAEQIVFMANDRCNQENLIEQLKNGVRALHTPVDNLISNWAYMAMASLAWTLKAWFALLVPERGPEPEKRRSEKETLLKMEFRTFLNAVMGIPAQLIRTGRKLIFRLLSWNQWNEVLFRVVDRLHQLRRC
jgi:hypothetical protein